MVYRVNGILKVTVGMDIIHGHYTLFNIIALSKNAKQKPLKLQGEIIPIVLIPRLVETSKGIYY